MKREYWKYLPFVFPYALRHKGHLTASLVLMLIGAGAALLEPLPLALLVDSVLGSHAAPDFVTDLVGDTPGRLILFVVGASLFVVLLINGLGVLDSYVNTKLEQRIALDLRQDLFAHALKLSRAFHDVTSPGDYIYRINFEAHAAGAITVAFPPLIQSFLTLIGMFVVTYLLAPALALLSLTVVPFIYYSTGIYGRVIEPRLIKARGLEGESLTIVNQTMQFLKVIIAFNRQPHELDRFRSQGQRAVNMRIKVTVLQTVFSLAVAVITAAGSALIIGVGAHYVLDERLTVGQLLIIISYIAAIYRPLQTIAATMALFQDQLIGIRFGKAMLEMPPEVVDRPDAVDLEQVEGAIEFDHVSFHYATREETLKDISFTLDAGQSLAIVGPTGAGKSTLVSLVPRFFDPHEGRILLDGRDLRELTQRSLRAHVAVVSQDAQLFAGTVWENVRYGRLDATDEEVVEAARSANADTFISALPEGYDTQLGDQGSRLSGGERQRICIARAFLKDAAVLILDEPTSAIDSQTEAVILEALDRLAQGRTTITIAHRLSTVRGADRLLVVDDGRVVEQGTHDELVRAGGLYARLCSLQGGAAAELAEVPSEPPPEPLRPVTAADVPAQRQAEPDGVLGMPVPRSRPKVVVLGLMSKMPVAGVVWQTVHYLDGLRRLGCDVYYVETYGSTPTMFLDDDDHRGTRRTVDFLDRTMRRFGFSGCWAYQALHDDQRWYGLSGSEVERLYRTADAVINLHGGTAPVPEQAAGRLVYLETDPVDMQIEVHDGRREALDFLDQHDAFFTFGENIGTPRSTVPSSERFAFLPTRQPIVLAHWEALEAPAYDAFTTIGNWRQEGRDAWFDGELYAWSKHHEFLKLLDLPRRSPVALELALGKIDDAEKAMLREHVWRVRDSVRLSTDIDHYRRYISGSRGELTVAKDQNVRLRSGWFSDRSATYLAAGRPVITQETGFSDVLPTGAGLLAFRDEDEAAAALADVVGSYRTHRRAAREIAQEFFAHDVVLPPLLASIGLDVRRGAARAPVLPRVPFPAGLDLTVAWRRPTTLTGSTLAAVASTPLPVADRPPLAHAPAATVVVVTRDGLPFNRLCLETLLADRDSPPFELVVVDNASTDGTLDLLAHLEASFPNVRVLRNDENRGFAAAVNQGFRAGTADVLVTLNNDTVVPPGWLTRLLGHTTDPHVGLVGAVTNGAPNEARLDVDYTTYGGMLRFARRRGVEHLGVCTDLAVATMFCVALRQDVYDRLGPLDEQFWPGMFEDDDYSLRARAAGLRVVCAQDCHVHHFGEASLGALVPSGEHGEAFRTNQQRFEQKWGRAWAPHQAAVSDAYAAVRHQVCSAIRATIPAGSSVLVVSKGDDALLSVEDRVARHFPQGEDGRFAGHYPATGHEAVAELERLHATGADYVVFPSTSLWWLDHYRDLRDHLEAEYGALSRDDGCLIYGPAR